jgi:hypothetical protein
MFDHKLEPKPTAIPRLEVITGAERHRRFLEDKARIIEETLVSGVVVSEVATALPLDPVGR